MSFLILSRRALRGAGAAMLIVGGAAVFPCGGALADRIKHPTAVFAGLDKITGRIIAFDVAIDETVQFGSLQLTPRVCYTRPPTEAPNTTGFVEVDELQDDRKTKRIFSGWMFASSPGLHGVEHPVYDVWLTDCRGGTEIIASPKEQSRDEEPPPNADVPGRKPADGAQPAQPKPPRKPKREIKPAEPPPEDRRLNAPIPDTPRAPRAPENPVEKFFKDTFGGRDPAGGN